MAGKRSDRVRRTGVIELGARLNQFVYFKDKPGATDDDKRLWLREELTRLRRLAGVPETLIDESERRYD